jgi:hypothetical protein
MKFFEMIGIDMEWFLVGTMGAVVLLFLLMIIVMVKHSKLKKKYKLFMKGAMGESLESSINEKFQQLDEIKKSMRIMNDNIIKIDEKLVTTFQKMGIIKYDAFKEMGGKLSFALTLLNNNNNGFIINSMHSSREGCYIYVKEVIKGEAFVVLSEEEQKSLSEAIKSSNFME